MKKSKSEEDLTAAEDPFMDKNSELGQIFKKMQQKKQGWFSIACLHLLSLNFHQGLIYFSLSHPS